MSINSTTFHNGGTAVSCNLLHGIFLIQEMCYQRKPLRNRTETSEVSFIPTGAIWQSAFDRSAPSQCHPLYLLLGLLTGSLGLWHLLIN